MAGASTTCTRYAAFLRGINVGGNRKVPMADLRELLCGLGYTDVATLLNSGNAVFTAAGRGTEVATAIEAALGERFGFTPSVVVRTLAELDDTIAADPFGDVVTEPKWYLVGFAKEAIDPQLLANLDPAALAPEQWMVRGAELHLWLPNSVAGSELMKRLPTPRHGLDITARNQNTLLKVRDLMASDAS